MIAPIKPLFVLIEDIRGGNAPSLISNSNDGRDPTIVPKVEYL
jgi:hypothetical protein